MSVRSEPSSVATAQMAGMDISTPLSLGNDHVTATINAAQNADSALGEANALSTNHPDREFNERTPSRRPKHTRPFSISRLQIRFVAPS